MSFLQTAVRPSIDGGIRVLSGAETRPSILQYERLEAQSWAPWLRYSRRALVEHVRSFPEEQFFAFDHDGLVGALSTNRISWDGDPATLDSWDAVAGARQDYRDTHDATGNTLVLMSMSIATRSRGSGIARQLLQAARRSVQERGLDHLIGDFRPSGYGSFKMRDETGFLSYVGQRDHAGVLADPWLRAVTRMGMTPLKVDPRAMVVAVTEREFESLRRVSASNWSRADRARDAALHASALPFAVSDCEFWEAEQTGTWYVNRQAEQAVYVESGVWGAVMDTRSEG